MTQCRGCTPIWLNVQWWCGYTMTRCLGSVVTSWHDVVVVWLHHDATSSWCDFIMTRRRGVTSSWRDVVVVWLHHFHHAVVRLEVERLFIHKLCRQNNKQTAITSMNLQQIKTQSKHTQHTRTTLYMYQQVGEIAPSRTRVYVSNTQPRTAMEMTSSGHIWITPK